jgi:hypothetical protein
MTIILLTIVNTNFITELKSNDSYKRMQENIALWKTGIQLIYLLNLNKKMSLSILPP